MRRIPWTVAILSLVLSLVWAQSSRAVKPRYERKGNEENEQAKKKGVMSEDTFKGLGFRALGPALTSGRVGDLAVDPNNPKRYFVAVCSGNVWKTENDGTTFEPVFDKYGSYSIGCVTLDPNNPHVVWVGTGENNSQRSVAYGDGVYKSTDGGENFKNMGLKESEHIGMIAVDPRNSDVVFVAAQGPLWRSGGDRGLYRTDDGGETWVKILDIDENTGVNEVHLDPRDPDVIYATSYQRRRHVWVLLDGGPGSGIYKSTDGGENWEELKNGIPEVDKGRIGLAISPANPDFVYAIIEAQDKEGGVFRSTDAGATWKKMSSTMSTSPQYYNELVCDPNDPDRVYSMDTFLKVSEDGGATFSRVPGKYKHVDNHVLWIDPDDTDHMRVGCDGGLYETWDRAATWLFRANLPVTQFYKIAIDNDSPFYNVYGGTQDNNTIGGPTRTNSASGIHNYDWYITLGGDGFGPAVDPEDPDIVYSQWQYGNLARYDRRSGEVQDIQPQPEKGEVLKWNWSSALIISPHDPHRLYYGANKLFRSDDRGDSWVKVSGDLTRQLDRNALPVMGRVWSVDAVAKNNSTSYYGTIVSLSESPLQEGLLYAGTDDGLIQVSEDGGQNWREQDSFSQVPDMSYVSYIVASSHDANTVYAAFDNHKRGDFKPYLLKSTNRGKGWDSISGDLPERGSVYAIAEDSVDPDLLFAGTEFGVFFTVDGGEHWIQLEGGIPTTACRDLKIQRRENDLVVGTMGRGLYVLDDYSPLRSVSKESLEHEAILFPVKKAELYHPATPLGGSGKASLGDAFFVAENPPFGAVFSYYLKDGYQSLREERRKKEKEIEKKGGDNPYPSWDELRKEDEEEAPSVVLVVRDDEGKVVRRVVGEAGKGIHRTAWDLRFPAPDPASTKEWKAPDPWTPQPAGPPVLPGAYTVQLTARVRGETKTLSEEVPFTVEALDLAKLPAKDKEQKLQFGKETAELRRAVLGARRSLTEVQDRIDHMRAALRDTPGADKSLTNELDGIEARVRKLSTIMNGDHTLSSRSEATTPGLVERMDRATWGWNNSSAPTKTQQQTFQIARDEFKNEVLPELGKLLNSVLPDFEKKLEALGAPWTPGRVPEYQG
ncbi:MAG TPA: glycosyl hydrolase [Candidatus Krumholzibacteria bacterium]|nr:glycosyl hydrolase [Candidatus Krumholzibacteria bacterium]